MIATTLWFSAIGGAARMVTGLLNGALAVTDCMVETKHRVETGEVRRRLVTLQLYITKEEFLGIAQHPAFERGLRALNALLNNPTGPLCRCPTCGTVQEPPVPTQSTQPQEEEVNEQAQCQPAA
jgi:hypothetical protein